MRCLILMIICLVKFQFSNAQVNLEDSTASIVAWWNKNDTMYYAKTATSFKIKEQDTIDLTTNHYLIEVVVKDSTFEKYELVWNYYLLMDSVQNTDTVKYLVWLYDLEFTVDSLGSVIDVNTFDIQTKNFRSQELHQHKSIFNEEHTLRFSNFLFDPQNIQNEMFEDIINFHRLYGVKLKEKEIYIGNYEYDIKQESPLKSRDSVEYYQRDSTDFYFVSSVETFDRQSIIEWYTKSLIPKLNINILESAYLLTEAKSIEIQKFRDYIFYNWGWIYNMYYEVETKNNSFVEKKMISFEVYWPDNNE